MASSSGGQRKRRPDFSCMEQPPLIKQLRGILSEYPDGGQILKELIQNADDAGASELKIMLESRRINRKLTDESPEYTKFFQAPALCIYNDAEFTEEDWRGIRMIYSSVKEEDSLKVGRFGLGFKSVFHMTDYPCVISGNTMLLIDPQRPANEVNATLKINEIHEIEGMETSDLLRAIGGKYGFDKSVVENGFFRGTMFWFPLREKASPISEDVYDVGKVEKLFGSLSSESSSILIFLKSLVRLYLLKMSQSGKEEHVLRVQIQDEKEIQTRRQSFFSCIKSASSKQDVSCVFTMTIKEETASATLKLTKWLVVNYYIVHSATNDFKRLIQSPKLGLSPCVGVAAKIEPFSAVEGHIFCFLPLPKEGTKLTGLPFHVNGFFALSQNRHHLKWATDDQDHQYVNDEILWNEKLLTEALPLAFQKALDTSISNAETYGNKASLVDGVYLWIPDLETVLDKWKLFYTTALQLFEDKNIVFCEQFHSWKSVSDAVFTTFVNLPHKFEFVKATVRKAIGSCGRCPVVVPEHVFLTLNLLFGHAINDISPVMLSSILKLNPKYKYMTDQEKRTLIIYLTSDGTIETLEGLDLLLLASGEWDTFNHNGNSKYVCSETEISMFPGSERKFIAPYERLDKFTKEVMRFICENRHYPIGDLDDSFLKTLLLQTIHSHLGQHLIMTEKSSLQIDWLRLVWSSISQRGIRKYADMPIFPVLLSGSFESKYQVKLVALQNSDILLKHDKAGNSNTCLDDDVEQCLRLLGFTVITHLPSWLSRDLIKKFVVRPTITDVKQLLQIKARSIYPQRINAFNKDATMSNRSRLLDFLAQFGSIDGDLVDLLQNLRLFRSIQKTGTRVTVDCDTHFVRESEQGNFPKNIDFPENCVLVGGNEETVAKQLNCTKLTLDKFMRLKLEVSTFDMSKTENKNVMMFFLNNIERFTKLIDSVSEMRFIKDTSGRLVKPSEIFDPFDEFLCRLFYGEHVFPAAKDALRPHRDAFIKIGMKGVSTILPENIYSVAKKIDSVSRINDKMYDKAKALQEYIENNPGVLRQTLWLDKTLGDELKDLSCFVYCSSEECEYHNRFPQLLKWFSTKNRLCCPSDMKEIRFWQLVCSSIPLIKTRSTELSSFYGWNIPPSAETIILQLKSIQQCSISSDMTLELLTILKTIYQALSKQSTPVVREAIVSNALVWTADNFQDPAKVIVKQVEDDIELKPYMYFLPSELGSLHTFFSWLGCHSRQDENVLVSVLQCMKTKYLNRKFSQAETKKDLKCAQMILERLAEADIDSSWASDNILMVVHSNSDQTIKFARLSECVYDDDPTCFNDVVDGESICYVHEQIPFGTVEKLGVKSVTGLSLADAQDFDHWGQRENFTTRLRSLLRDGYTDGLSVPKELLQNADDAGATELCFVYDERRHLDSRERLLSKSLADFQGSALWCYNNKVFSEKDLQNIKRFNDSEKVDDLSTIGKFGLGFNAVYNITDIPSFISGADMLIFDPHEKYLIDPQTKKTTRGKRIPLSKRTLVKRHTDQFKPFQDMFGCNVLNDPFTRYQGTLFRFPLRTAQQADMSEICQTVYSHDEVLSLLKMFIHSAEQLLLFCQNVSLIKLYHISADAASANDMKMLYMVRKESLKLVDDKCTSVETGILAKAVSVHKQQHGSCIEEHHSTSIRQTFCDNSPLFPKVNWPKSDVKSTWLITWVLKDRPTHLESFDALPLVAVASLCKTQCDWTPQALEKNTVGDCDFGHIFCFLPLPINTGLSFHINGCFRVSDDRQRLVLLNEDDKKSGYKSASDAWNTYLLQDPLVLALLKQIQKTQLFCQTQEDAYRLWPHNFKQNVTPFVRSFYRAIVDYNDSIFKDHGQCLPYGKILILTRGQGTKFFHDVLQFLVRVPLNKNKTVMEVPEFVCKYLRVHNNDRISIVENAFVSMNDALIHFLHNINDKYWADKQAIRNNILAYAITVADEKMKTCLKTRPCIPTEPFGRLRSVLELVHPNSKLTKMFSETDERFVTKCESLYEIKVLSKLVDFGMNVDRLPTDLIIDRCKSLQSLATKCVQCTSSRMVYVLQHLSEPYISKDMFEQLKSLHILPVLQRPTEWIFTWKADSMENQITIKESVKCSEHQNEIYKNLILGQPIHLFRMSLRHSVGSVCKLVDESYKMMSTVLENLGVNGFDTLTIYMLLEQLDTLGSEFNIVDDKNTRETHHIVNEVYKTLDSLTINMSKEEFQTFLTEHFGLIRDRPIIDVGETLVPVNKVAKLVERSCPPHMYALPATSYQRWRILDKFGVRERFTVIDVIRILQLTVEQTRHNVPVKQVAILLENLIDCMEREGKTYADLHEYKENIIAPDRDECFLPTYKLALEDEGMPTKTKLRLLHEAIPPKIGKAIGVRPKDLQILRKHTRAIPFGQREDLTTRLNGLLKDYPCDESIMKELIQNADDAGAHEIHFIKYFEAKKVGRTLEHDSELKPALCVYNDSCFTEEDFKGIQDLGIGSKANNPFKIGRFGIGFNAVYHITDVPSFLTKGPDLIGSGEVCLFDPLFKHISELSDGEPGIRWNVDGLMEEFPDTVVGFPVMANSCGTMFRLPLRQKKSKISNNCFKPVDIQTLLNSFIQTMPGYLHFVKNIRTIKVMTYSKGKYQCEYEVTSEITEDDEQRRTSFFASVKKHATSLGSTEMNVEYTMRINDNKKKKSAIWLIANQFNSCFPLEQQDEMTAMTGNGLIPIGGVSMKLCANPRQIIAALSKDGSTYKSWQPVKGNAYCFLPLPISTGLPFHVNGHFQLDRGRRLLWNQGNGKKWNEFIMSVVVSDALKNALKFLQKYLINDNMHMNELHNDILRRRYLQMYYCHFPKHQLTGNSDWEFFAKEFYRLLIKSRMRLFPCFPQNLTGLQNAGNVHNQREVEWVHLSTDIENLDGGVVNTLFKGSYCQGTEQQEQRYVENIIRKLLIKLSDTDNSVVVEIEKSTDVSIIRTEPHVVMRILKDRIESVDLCVQNSVFETAACVKILLKFICKNDRFVDDIDGLPLCLTNDNVVRRFMAEQDIFCSRFCELLPGSSSLFVHKDLVFLLNNEQMFLKNIFKRFTVRSFVSLLPSSFDPEIFCKGENVRWKESDFDFFEPHTIYRLFEFLHGESFVSGSSLQPCFDRKLFLENVSAVSNWSFLPSHNTSGPFDSFELIPLNRSYTLLSDIHLCEEVTKKVLQNIKLPSLDKAALTDSSNFDVFFAAKYLTSSANKPNDLLRCLNKYRHILNESGLTSVDARCVLRYFNNNINVLKSRGHEAKQLLKELPLYETVQKGLLVSIVKAANVIVLQNEIPFEGLVGWTDHQNIILIKRYEDLREIHSFLKLPYVSAITVYIEYILPTIMHMEKHHWLPHVQYIKDNLMHYSISNELSSEQEQLVNLLREIPFIEINGVYFCANQLYDGNHCVFQQMIDPGLYLPTHFQNWLCFMKLLGLNVCPTSKMLLAFAKRIARDGALQMTEYLIASSNILVEYLLGPAGKEFDAQMYSKIRRVKFVVSYSVSSELSSICQPCSSSEAFICFEGSCGSQFEDICWTSVPLLLHMPRKPKYCELLGIKQEPDVDSVISHCQKICDILQRDFEKQNQEINNTHKIMENIYTFLSTKQEAINQTRLIETPIILIPGETLVKPSLVFLRQTIGEEIKPYLYKAPHIYQCFFNLFERLGATAEARCWQYANVLSTIQKQFKENELHDSALEKASMAIKHMFTIISITQNTSTDFDGVNVLYLPNVKRVLTKSNELTVCDNNYFKRKLESPCQLNIFIGFQELEIDLKDPVEPFMNLPHNLKPRVLSQDVTERVCIDDIQVDVYNEDALSYERLFYSQAFHEGLCRLLRHQNGKNNTTIWKAEDDTHLKSILSKVRIKAVTGLKTLLVFKGELVPGVSIEKLYYVDEVKDDDTALVGDNTCLAFHLYYQRSEAHSVHSFNSTRIIHAGLMKLVERCTRGLLEKEQYVLVYQFLDLRNNPDCISQCLDQHQIRSYGSLDELRLSVFPQPGSYVEEKFFPFLVQQIQPIPEHSYRFVALEIGNDDEDDEEGQLTFIYAHVLRKVPTTNTSVLSINYEVDAGIGVHYAGRIMVPIFRLYLFLPQMQDTSTDIEVYDTEPVGSMPFDETCERIMSMLQEAFDKFCLQDRKRIIRRLLLKWHPDKNLGNEEYATRILNFIRHCIVRLERGENLTINVEPSAPDMRASTYRNTCTAAYATGQVFAACYNNNVDAYRSHNSFAHSNMHRDPVRSPGEFKRWIKQAKLDFLTGQAQLNCTEKHPKTFNWICYICHQACEKALKAAWFLKDANRCPIRQHSLVVIANGLDQNIADKALSFEHELGIQSSYAKLRYPDSVADLRYPDSDNNRKIPSDVFSKDKAEFAVTTAKHIMEMVDELRG